MKEILRLCFVLTVIAAVSAGVLAFVDQKTQEPIANALKAEEMAAVKSVLPPFDNEADKDTLTIGDELVSYKFYRGRMKGEIVGAAFAVIAPNGYSGDIKVMVGVDTAGVVQGIEILDHRETPGLGAKIETAEFRDQYKGRNLGDPETWDVMKDGGTFKQITGATISSRAVTHCIARALEFFAAKRNVILDLGEGAAESAGESAEEPAVENGGSGE
jgi:electron transport complex protein RnfG